MLSAARAVRVFASERDVTPPASFPACRLIHR